MIVKTQKAAAEQLGVTSRTLRDWRAQHADFPDTDDGYDLDAINRWRQTLGAKGSELDEKERSVRLQTKEAELRIKQAEATRREREEEAAAGNILPRDEYELAAVEIITITRDRFLALPKRLMKLVPKKYQAKFRDAADKEVRKILEDMARMAGDLERFIDD